MQIVIPLTSVSANNITLTGDSPLVKVIDDGVNHDGDTTYLTRTANAVANYSFIFSFFTFPTDIENNPIDITFVVKGDGGVQEVAMTLEFYSVLSQSDSLTTDNLVFTQSQVLSRTDTSYNLQVFDITEGLKNFPLDSRGKIGLKVDLITARAPDSIRVTSVYLTVADAGTGDSLQTQQSMTVGNSLDVGQLLPLPNIIVPTGFYLGYDDFNMVVLSSVTPEQAGTRTGLVVRSQKDGGSVSLNAKSPMTILVNCILLADNENDMRRRFENIKKVFDAGLQFMQFDRDNRNVDEIHRRGFFGIVKAPIQSVRKGMFNREFTLAIEVPDGFYQSEKEFTFNFIIDDGQANFPTGVVVSTVGKKNIAVPFLVQLRYYSESESLPDDFILSSDTDPIAGNFAALSTIEIIGTDTLPGTSTIQVDNVSRGESLIWTGTLVVSDILIIDSVNEKVFLTAFIGGLTTDVTSGITSDSVFPKFNQSSLIIENPDRPPEGVLPKDNINNFMTFISDWAIGTITMDITLKWRRVF